MEKIIHLGEKKNLVGFYTPCLENETANTGVIILNAGLVNRAGPFRMGTELARELGKHNFSTFRFDLSGMGESTKLANDSRELNQRYLDDIGEAIAFLKSENIKNIVVLGLCTGADLAHKAATLHPEVNGSVLLDGYGYPNFKFWLGKVTALLRNPTRLPKAVLSRLVPSSSGKAADNDLGFTWELPTKQSYINDMQTMHSRNVQQLYIYTGGVKDYYAYKEQFHDAFSSHSFAKDVTVDYLEHADHTFIVVKHRKEMFKLITQWLNHSF